MKNDMSIKGCAKWFVGGFFVLELVGILFVPGCSTSQLLILDFLTGGSIKHTIQQFTRPPCTPSNTGTAQIAPPNPVSLSIEEGPPPARWLGNLNLAPQFSVACVLRGSDGAFVASYSKPQPAYNTATTFANGFFYTLSNNTLCARNMTGTANKWCVSTQALQLVVHNGIIYTDTSAFRAADGTLLWGHLESMIRVQLVEADGDTYFIGQFIAVSSSNTSICTFNATNGHQLWCHTDPSQTFMGISNGVAIFRGGPNNSLTVTYSALRLHDGSVLWQKQLHTTSPSIYVAEIEQAVVSGGEAYLFSPTKSSFVIDLHTSDGTIRWQRALLSTSNLYPPMVIAADGILYTTRENYLSAQRGSDGTFLWKRHLSTREYTGYLSVSNGIVYIMEDELILYALRASDGKPLWESLPCTDPNSWPVAGKLQANGSIQRCYWHPTNLPNNYTRTTFD